MTDRRALIAGALVASIAPQQGRAQAVALRLRSGLNIHYLMNSPDLVSSQRAYAADPFASPRHAMSDADLSRLAGLGFDFIRLTVSPGVFLADGSVRAPAMFDRLVAVVRQLLKAGFAVVVDLHPQPPVAPYTQHEISMPAGAAVWPAYLELVGQIGARLEPFAGERVAFEVLNEPHVPASTWPPMLEQLYLAARSRAKSLTLVLSGPEPWTPDVTIGFNPTRYVADRVLFTVHDYEPLEFTHQTNLSYSDLSGVRWPAAKEATAPGAFDPRLQAYIRGGDDPQNVAKRYARLGAWADRYGIDHGRIFIGEFGVQRRTAAKPAAPDEDRAAWLTAIRGAAEAQGFGWAYFDYENPDYFGLRNPDGTLDAVTLRGLGLLRP